MMITTDNFLDGRVRLNQPDKGYRAGIDAVLLAAAVHPKVGDRVLDMGAGVGAVMLCLAHRYPNIQITGLELQPELVELNQQNILLNEAGHVQVFQGNVLAPPKELVPNSYNHVTTNPPYFEYGSRAYSEDASKMLARHQSEIDLAQWIEACVRMVKPRGYFTMIHRSDRLDDILMELKKKMGGIKIFPLWPTAEEPAKLVLLQARKGVKTPCQLLPGIVLHQSNKAYTPKAEELFRGLGSLDL